MATTGCKCDPCSVLRTKCGACLGCVPRYLCVKGTYTPYAESAGDCAFEFCTRMFWDCGSSKWIVLDIPRYPSNFKLGITMEIYEDDYPEECKYLVYAFGEQIYFETDEVIAFDHTDDSGNSWEVEIGGAGMVANPLSRAQCKSPCLCATCIPRKYCLYLNTDRCHGDGAGSASWNGDGWDGTVGEWDVVMTLLPCSTGCGAKIVVDGPDGEHGEGQFFFESPDGPEDCDPPFRTYRCVEGTEDTGEANTMRRGGLDGCVFKERVTTYGIIEVDLTGYDGSSIGTLKVVDNPCGCSCSPLSATNCFGACPALESTGLSCPPPILHAELFSASCSQSFVMGDPNFHISSYSPSPLLPAYSYCQRAASFRTVGGVTTGPTVVFYQGDADRQFDGQFMLYHEGQSCDDSGKSRPSDYRLLFLINFWCCNSMPGPCYVISTVTPTVSSCEPFTLEFDLGITWGTIANGTGYCTGNGPCDGLDEPIKLRITL